MSRQERILIWIRRHPGKFSPAVYSEATGEERRIVRHATVKLKNKKLIEASGADLRSRAYKLTPSGFAVSSALVATERAMAK